MNVPRLRLMCCGRPKTGKTGALVGLLNAGFEIGVLDFDGNSDPLLAFADSDKLANLSVITLQDRKRLTSGTTGGKEYVQLADEPMAFRRGFQALDNWTKFDPAHDWGAVKTWGTNRVLALDTLTSMGEAGFDRVRHLNNRNRGNTRDSDFGVAMDDQAGMLAKLMSSEFGCHVIINAHLKMIGPKEPRFGRDDDEDLVDIKMAIAKANAEVIQTRLYPHALGRALPEVVLKHVPAAVIFDVIDGKRVIITQPRADVAADVGVPGKVPATLKLETGLLAIMQAVTGHDRPY